MRKVATLGLIALLTSLTISGGNTQGAPKRLNELEQSKLPLALEKNPSSPKYQEELREEAEIEQDKALKRAEIKERKRVEEEQEQKRIVQEHQRLAEEKQKLAEEQQRLADEKQHKEKQAQEVQQQLSQQRTLASRSNPPTHENSYTIFKASAYYPGAGGINGNPNGITASGTVVQYGVTVAVDPSVIPLYSQIEIICPSYPSINGVYTALDTGGAIKGNRLDIAIYGEEACYRFGMREVQVRVVRRGK